jgi:hypothetical protein
LKRNVTDVLRRGFDSTVANWPVIALRIAESLVFAAIIIASVIAAVIPAVVAAGLAKDDIANSSDPASFVASWLIDHVMLFVWIFLLGFLILGVLIAIHSFVEGGSTQIYVDGERAAARRNSSARDAFGAFSIDRWLAGGAASWWRIFWLYNLAWSVGLVFVLVPLIITMIGMLAVSDTTARVVVGCAGVALAVLILIPVGIVTSIWCTKAITICVARALPAREALRLGWREFRTDLGRHLAVALILFVISMAVSSLVSVFSVPMSITEHRIPTMALMFAPIRLVTGVVQGIVGAAIGSCLLACFVSMTEER